VGLLNSASRQSSKGAPTSLLSVKPRRGGLLSSDPLLALGRGLLQAGSNGDNIMLGVSNGMLGLEEAQRQEMQDELQGRQFAAQESHYTAQADRWRAEADKERQQQEMFAKYAEGLSPEDRGMFLAAPEAFVKQKIEATYRPPSENPSSVREYEYFNSLTPEAQSRYLQLKRADQMANLGGSVAFRGPDGSISANLPKTLPPENMPSNVAAAAAAGATGKAAGERQAGQEQRAVDAGANVDTLQQAIDLLPTATGGKLEQVRDRGLAVFNESTTGAQNAAQLDLLAGQLLMKQPRFEGPQGVLDVQVYKQMAGDLNNRDLPTETRMAAAKKMQELNAKYAGGAVPGGKAPPAVGTVRNGFVFQGGNPADRASWVKQ